MNINGDLILAGNLLPAQKNTYDIGSSALQWRNIYSNRLSINGGDISSYRLGVSGDIHITGYSIFDDYVNIGTSGQNTYKLYVNGTSYFNNLVTINTSNQSHKGVKIGNTYITAIDGDLIFQNNTSIRFGSDNWDYDKWAGLKYVPSSKEIYLGIADRSAFTGNSTLVDGKLYLVNSHLLPLVDNRYDLGDAYHNWRNLFITKGIKSNTRFYPIVGNSYGSQWYKIILPYASSGYAGSTWMMISMDITLGGPYGNGPSGKIELAYYFTYNYNTSTGTGAWVASNVYGSVLGSRVNSSNIEIRYRLSEPNIMYIKAGPNRYNGISIQNLHVHDSAPSYDWLTTKIETSNAPDTTIYNATVPLAFYSTNGDTKARIENDVMIPAGKGFYWDPYVESASDGSDAAGIWQIKSGVAGGTELRISQQNDSTDVINLCAPYYIYFNSKRAFAICDSWLRINEDLGFSSGIYTGSSIVRSDNQLQVGSGGANFYANNSGNGYFSNTLGIAGTNTGYKLYVNGTSYFNGDISGSGNIYPITNNSKNLGSSTLKWANAYATTFHGSLDGNAASATYTTQLLGVNSSNTPYGVTEGNLVRAVWDGSRWLFKAGSYNCRVEVADKLTTARSIALSGAITGSASFDGSGNITIETTSTASNTVLDNRYVLKSGDTMTGHLDFTDNVGIHGLMGGGSDYWRLTGTGTGDEGVLQLTIGDNATTDYFDIIFSDWSGTDIKAIRFGGSSINAYVPLYGAVWNDYAEFRICKDNFKPGQVVCENNDDTLNISTYRLQPGANIVSDTYGFAIGETDNAKCPIAVSGRVLAYTYEPKEKFNAGDAVCAGPNGTVSKMTRQEIKEYPERIIGTVSAVPEYETWGTGNVKVNGRIWIKVK